MSGLKRLYEAGYGIGKPNEVEFYCDSVCSPMICPTHQLCVNERSQQGSSIRAVVAALGPVCLPSITTVLDQTCATHALHFFDIRHCDPVITSSQY